MPLISGTVPSLVNGISQQPPTLRLPTQGQSQVNGLSHVSRGLQKRPCTEHVADVSGVTSDTSDDVFIHTIRRSEDEAYALVIKGGVVDNTTTFTVDTSSNLFTTSENHGLVVGDYISFNGSALPAPLMSGQFYKIRTQPANTTFTLVDTTDSTATLSVTTTGSPSRTLNIYNSQVKLFDLTGFATGTPGTEVWIHGSKQSSTVSANATKLDDRVNGYFANFTATSGTAPFSPSKLSATTIADFTFLLNKTQKVRKESTEQVTSSYQSMVYIKVGDYACNYKAKITAYATAEMDDTNKKTNFGDAGVFEITLKTPDNKTESMTGAGDGAKTKVMNNQNAVLVKNIAYALNKGKSAVGGEDVNLVKTKLVSNEAVVDSGDITITIQVDGTQTLRSDAAGTRTTSLNITNIITTGIEVGMTITGTNIPANTTITGITTDSTGTSANGTITISAAPTASTVADIAISWADGVEYTGTKGVMDEGVVETNKPGGINSDDLNAISSGTPWAVTYDEGESIMTIENNEFPFVLELTDGKGDVYMKAINGSDEVPKFSDLPSTKVKPGFVAKISGDKSTGQDDYYVKYENSVYKETFRPKYVLDTLESSWYKIDNTSMPMQLYKQFGTTTYNSTLSNTGDGIYFILKPVDWGERTVGDQTTAPFPSFADYAAVDSATFDRDDALYTINDIFFHRNRLGLISDENVVLSEAAGYFNFFPNTTLSVLDTAPVDVAVSNNQVAILKSAIPFQENLLLFSDLQQFKLTSDQFLTPTSASVDVATNFETSTIAKPVPAGKTIFFPFQRGAFSGIREYLIDIASETNDANEVTSHVPALLEGTVTKMAVSSNEEILGVLTDSDRTKLYVYKYFYEDKEKLQSSWSTWQFDAQIVDIAFIGSVAIILFKRGTDVLLEKLNLSVDSATTIMDDKVGIKLDRRVRLSAHTIADDTPTPIKAASESSAAWEATKTWTDKTQKSTSGTGTGIKFDIETDASGNPTFTLSECGSGYAESDTVTYTDPGSTVNTAVITLSTIGTQMSVSSHYDDVTHDKIADTSGGKKISSSQSNWGVKIKIDADDGIIAKPRVGQTFTSSHDVTATYTVVSSGEIDTTTDPDSVEIEITPSIDVNAKMPDNAVLTFKERELVYVTEQGQIVKLDAVKGVLNKGNQLSNSVGNSTPDVFAGIPYDFEYEFSEQFVKSGDDSINSGRLQLRNFEVSYANTGNFEVQVSPRPFDDRVRKVNTTIFTGKVVGSSILGRTTLETGVFRVPVYCNSKDVKIKVKSDSWLPLAIQSADWEAFQVLRNQRI